MAGYKVVPGVQQIVIYRTATRVRNYVITPTRQSHYPLLNQFLCLWF